MRPLHPIPIVGAHQLRVDLAKVPAEFLILDTQTHQHFFGKENRALLKKPIWNVLFPIEPPDVRSHLHTIERLNGVIVEQVDLSDAADPVVPGIEIAG